MTSETDPLSPTHTLRLIQPELPVVLVTSENMAALAAALPGAELMSHGALGPEPRYIRAKLSDGVWHEWEAGDFMLLLASGPAAVFREDVGRIFQTPQPITTEEQS